MGNAEWEHLKAQVVRGVRSPGCVIAHIGLFLVASTILVLVNAITSSGELWFWRPLLILGGILALHIGLVIAIGRSSRVRVAAASVGSRWSRWLASRSRRAEPDARSLQHHVTSWLHDLRSSPASSPAATSPVLPQVDAEAVAWPAATPYGSWPAARPDPAASADSAPATTWPEGAPAWSASWPAPPALAPQVRASHTNGTAPNGAHRVEPAQPHPNAHPNLNPNPTWDQLEVAAASWLAQRAAEPGVETAR